MSERRKLRVALGPLDAAGTVQALTLGLRERGHDATAVMWRESPYGFRADRLVGSFAERASFALAAPLRLDVLHGQGGRTWMSYADMLLARAGRRTCLIQYNGSDARTPDVAERLHPARARIVDPGQAAGIRRHRRLGGLVAHAAVVQDLELPDYLRACYRRIFVAPFAIDLPAIERLQAAAPPPAPGGPVRIVHAPSNPTAKGTPAIERCLEAAGGAAEIESRVVTGRPHGEVLEALAGADLVIDQLNAETPGVLSAEAMALGKPVLCEHDEAKLASFARPTPVVAITVATLPESLVELCRDEGRRAELGAAGREYALRVHAPGRAAMAAERIYEVARRAPSGLYEAGPDGLERLEEG